MSERKPEDYRYIAAWGVRFKSAPSYVVRQQERACTANAPLNAIYERYDGNGPNGDWMTLESCSERVREYLNAVVSQMTMPA